MDHPGITLLTWSKSPPAFSYNNMCIDLDHLHHQFFVWSRSFLSLSYNHKCNDLDQPVNESSRRLPAMWSKSFPSFSYNNMCNDLDHTSVTSRASGPNHCLHFPITISVTKWTSCRIITFSPGPNRNLHFPITICATIWTTDAWKAAVQIIILISL